MQYMLIHAGAPDLDEAWNDEAWAALNAWLDEAIGSGVSIEGGPLRLDADATTVKVRDGQLIVTDGPYAETKEQVAGYDVIECASAEEAVRWARRLAPTVPLPLSAPSDAFVPELDCPFCHS